MMTYPGNLAVAVRSLSVKYDLQSCFDHLFSPERIDIPCDHCSKLSTFKRMKIVAAPNVLVLLVKRYIFDHNTQCISKDHTQVTCPNELKLPCGTILHLRSIINHSGDTP